MDHPQGAGAHDDVANAVAGAVVGVFPSDVAGWGLLEYYRRESEKIASSEATPKPDFGYRLGGGTAPGGAFETRCLSKRLKLGERTA